MGYPHDPPVKIKRRTPFLFSLLYLAGVMTLAFGLRVISLNSLPLSLSLDEAVDGLDALQLVRLSWFTPFLQNNFGRETLFFYLQGVGLGLYGVSFFSLRFVSALVGTLTIPLLYIVGQRLALENLCFPPAGPAGLTAKATPRQLDRASFAARSLISLLAATGLAVSYWHIYFSRVGLRAILLPPLLLGLVWCFWRGWFPARPRPTPLPEGGVGGGTPQSTLEPATDDPTSQRLWLAAAGLLLGLTFYTYLAARLLPLLFIAFVSLEFIRNRSVRKEKVLDFLIFSSVAALAALPLALYFQQNPQALASRTQAISILAGQAPLVTLAGNLIALLRIHFLGGVWLGEWPALHPLSALGLLLGLPLCLYHLKKPASRFLLLWWLIGTAPVLLSRQDWQATTTLLRGIIAWPALFLISAVGLASLAQYLSRLTGGNLAFPRSFTPLLLLLIFGALTSAHNYFSVWATTANKFSDHPAYLARYLNSQTGQLTLTPLVFYAETVTNFLLQAHYPILNNIDADRLRLLLSASTKRGGGDEDRRTVYLLPHEATTAAAFVLLAPAGDGRGTAYLLPPLTPAQMAALADYTRTLAPLSTVLDSEREPIAQVYPWPAAAPVLWPWLTEEEGRQASEPASQATFNDYIRLTGYLVEPAVLKPGETVSLQLNWQAQQPLDGDYYLFIHLFDVAQRQRHGQVNAPLTGLLFEAHRWPVGLVVPDIHHFRLPADAPEGAYRFEVGLYHASSQQRLPVTISPPGSSIQGATEQSLDDKIILILGKFHIRRQAPPLPEYPLTGIQFEDHLALIGLDLPALTLQPGQPLTYTLHWQALAPIPADYTVFTHLLDAAGKLQAQQDNPPQQGHYPTSWWDPGEIILDSYSLPLPPNLAPGPYTLRVGLYEPITGRRLPLKNGGADFVDLPTLIKLQN